MDVGAETEIKREDLIRRESFEDYRVKSARLEAERREAIGYFERHYLRNLIDDVRATLPENYDMDFEESGIKMVRASSPGVGFHENIPSEFYANLKLTHQGKPIYDTQPLWSEIVKIQNDFRIQTLADVYDLNSVECMASTCY